VKRIYSQDSAGLNRVPGALEIGPPKIRESSKVMTIFLFLIIYLNSSSRVLARFVVVPNSDHRDSLSVGEVKTEDWTLLAET
jgi:hypothetical protein